MSEWQNRYTVRRFDRTYIPEKHIIDQVKETVQYIPSQLGAVDHMWCLLGPQDQTIKDWLVEKIYFCDDSRKGHREYFSALADAPYMFTSFQVIVPNSVDFDLTDKEMEFYRVPKVNEYRRNNAFHAGVLVSQGLKYNLDCCQIACTEGWSDELLQDYQTLLWNRFSDSLSKISIKFTNGEIRFSKNTIGVALMSVGMGKGLPHTENNFTPYNDGVTFTGQKPKKWFSNIVD